jgi:hypothetical protein
MAGRLLKREMLARKLSANRLSLDIGVPVGPPVLPTSLMVAARSRRYRGAARPVFQQ